MLRSPGASPPRGPPPAGSVPPALAPTPAASASPSIASPTAAPVADGAPVYGATTGPVRIVIRASGDSWVLVRDSDQTLLITRVLKAGEVFRVPDRPGITMRTGNAGMLDITVDGHTVPPVGGNGIVRRNIVLDPDRLMAGSANGE